MMPYMQEGDIGGVPRCLKPVMSLCSVFQLPYSVCDCVAVWPGRNEALRQAFLEADESAHGINHLGHSAASTYLSLCACRVLCNRYQTLLGYVSFMPFHELWLHVQLLTRLLRQAI